MVHTYESVDASDFIEHGGGVEKPVCSKNMYEKQQSDIGLIGHFGDHLWPTDDSMNHTPTIYHAPNRGEF